MKERAWRVGSVMHCFTSQYTLRKVQPLDRCGGEHVWVEFATSFPGRGACVSCVMHSPGKDMGTKEGVAGGECKTVTHSNFRRQTMNKIDNGNTTFENDDCLCVLILGEDSNGGSSSAQLDPTHFRRRPSTVAARSKEDLDRCRHSSENG